MDYELRLTKDETIRFKRAVKSKMAAKGLGIREVAEAIGYTDASMYSFFKEGNRSRFVAAALAEYLSIAEDEWKGGDQEHNKSPMPGSIKGLK